MIMINFLICFLSLVALTQNLNRDFDIFYFCIIIKSEQSKMLIIFVLLFKTKSSLPIGLFIVIMKRGVWIGFRTL